MIRIIHIDREHPLYPQEVELRQRVLLDPIGIDLAWLEAHFPGAEARARHFVAAIDHPAGERVVGCVLLVPEPGDDAVGKLMQMAVDPQRQREGVGRRLVAALERAAFGDLGMHRIYCHARDDAVPFYAALGWRLEGEPFDEAGIRHSTMVFDAGR